MKLSKSNNIDSRPANDIPQSEAMTDFESQSADTGEKAMYAVMGDVRLIQRINYIKDYYLIISDSEMLRLCIGIVYHQIEPKRKVSVT